MEDSRVQLPFFRARLSLANAVQTLRPVSRAKPAAGAQRVEFKTSQTSAGETPAAFGRAEPTFPLSIY